MNLLRLTLKRLSTQPGLALATLLGLITAVALITTVPLYADAASFRVMQTSLDETAEENRLPPFAYIYRYVGAWHGAIQWEDVSPLDDYLSQQASADLGLPTQLLVRHFETDQYGLFPAATDDYNDVTRSLASINLATTSGIADHIQITEGHFPETAESSSDSSVQVLVADELALELGLQVGDELVAYNLRDRTDPHRAIPLQVAGVWIAKDATDPFWFYKPNLFKERLLVTEETFTGRLSPYLSNEIHLAVWYLLLDGSRVDVNDVGWLTSRARRVEQHVTNLLPNTRNDTTPIEALQQYNSAVSTLTPLLAAFSVPLVGLILAFIGLIAGFSVNERRNEIAVLNSRGATAVQIIFLAILEGLLLGLVALALGLGGGLLLTQLMGRARTFLDFSADTTLRIAVTQAAWQAGALAVGAAILAQVLPTIAAAHETIISYKQDQARTVKRPWWQRAWLDVLLFIPAAYTVYLLTVGQDSILPGQTNNLSYGAADPFQNPLLLLLPALVTSSLTLFALRLLPWFMLGLDWLLGRARGLALLLAIRYLARTPGRYTTPLLLLVLTASLAVFTATLAQTLDYQLYDEALYRVGSDLNLIGPGLSSGSVSSFAPTSSLPQPGVFLPMSEYREFPGVVGAARIGRYSTVAQAGSTRQAGEFLGIDSAEFGQVTYWRKDFSATGLGYLMNNLAANPDGVLVTESFLRENGLRVGDIFRLQVHISQAQIGLTAQIVGSFRYFPTWYPEEEELLVVGNLETLFQQTGGDLPYEVWLQTTLDFDPAAFEQALQDRGLYTWIWREPYGRLQVEQVRPERQGLFGLLSVGFAAAALVTVIGFFLYALFSLRRRFVELGILQAIGLSVRQTMLLIACELAFLVGIGLGLGVALGSWISRLFIPALQTAESQRIPPYLVEIARPAVLQVSLLFGFMFLVALGVLVYLLARMRIFQAIKLGENV